MALSGTEVLQVTGVTNAGPSSVSEQTTTQAIANLSANLCPYVLGQSGIPLIMAGDGSMADNGVLTLTTALSVTYANAYVYLPLHAISTTSAAGWYYAVFSSTTAATVYNNTYTSGTPTIPASPTAFSTTGPGNYTGASTAITAYSVSVPASSVGVNGALRTTAVFAYTNTGDTKTVAIKYSTFVLMSAALTTTLFLAGQFGFRNRGVANKQIPTSVGTSVSYGTATSAPTYGTIDTTAAQNLTVALTNATTATNNIVLESISVEILPGV